MTSKIFKKAALISITYLYSLSGDAIVIRHDVKKHQYLASSDSFPPLATFYIDGGHGTLIAPQWIVTAAHASFCIEPGRLVKVHDKLHKIKSLYVNRDYTPGQSHDIALVELTQPVDGVQPAILYSENDEQDQIVRFIGIGGTGNGIKGQTIDNAQNNGVLRIAENRIEQAKGPIITFTFDKGDKALPLEGVSGAGDSGGPAYIVKDSHFELLGISSRFHGGKVGQYGITEVYTRVSFFKPWVLDVMTSNENDRRAIADRKLQHLPAGVTEDLLPQICNAITLQ